MSEINLCVINLLLSTSLHCYECMVPVRFCVLLVSVFALLLVSSVFAFSGHWKCGFSVFELCHLIEVGSKLADSQLSSEVHFIWKKPNQRFVLCLSVCYSLTKRDQCIFWIDEEWDCCVRQV